MKAATSIVAGSFGAIKVSDSLATDLRERLEVNADDTTLDDEERMDMGDVFREALDGVDDSRSPWWDHRHELRAIAIDLGIATPLDAEAAKQCAQCGGASVKAQTWFTHRGQRFEFATWEVQS